MIDGSSLSHVFKGRYTGKSIVFVWMNGHVSSSRLGGIYGSSIQNATVHLPKDLGLLNLELLCEKTNLFLPDHRLYKVKIIMNESDPANLRLYEAFYIHQPSTPVREYNEFADLLF